MLSRQKQIDIKHRSTLRGIRKCKECGQFNGTRALGCKNYNCPLAVGAIDRHRGANGKQMKNRLTSPVVKSMKLDAIQLITYNDTRIYSVQVRERNATQRNFVEITDVTLSSDENSYVFSRNAICYDDSCNFNANLINCCKHVSHVLEEGVAPHRKSYVCDINCDKITLLNISDDHRQYLKRIYLENIKRLAIVQRINQNLFTIVCEKTQSLPSGILHITIHNNNNHIVNNLDEWFYCECSNKKQILKNFKWNYRKCCHFYMMIVAVLSNTELQNEFQLQMCLINEFFHNSKPSIFDSNLLIADDFIKYSENILNDSDNIELLDGDCDYDNYMQMNNKSIDYNVNNSLTNNCSIQNDVPDINCSSNSANNVEVIGYSSSTLINNNNNNNNGICEDRHSSQISSSLEIDRSSSATADLPSTYNNNNSFNDDENYNNKQLITDDSIGDNFQSLKFIDCQIELFDELISTDHIDLCNDDIYLNDLVDTAMNNYFAIDENINADNADDSNNKKNDININSVNDDNYDEYTKSNSIINSNAIIDCRTKTTETPTSSIPINTHFSTPTKEYKNNLFKKKFQGNKSKQRLKPYNNMPTIKWQSVNGVRISKLKKYSIESTDNNKSPKKRLENQFKRKYNLKRNRLESDDGCSKHDANNVSTLKFDNWLESIIEQINITMDFNDVGKPEQLVFSVFHEFFEILSKKFSIGSKLRIPNETNLIQDGKYKGLTMFTYRFSNINVIRHIFTTKNMNIEIERRFINSKSDNLYKNCDKNKTITTVNGQSMDSSGMQKYRKITPTEYSTHLMVSPQSSFIINAGDPNHKNTNDKVFQIDWIPNVLPKSKHGEMRILFEFEHRKNGFRILNN